MKNTKQHPQERTYTVDEAVQWLKDGHHIECDIDDKGLFDKVFSAVVGYVPTHFRVGDCARVLGTTIISANYPARRTLILLSQIQSNTVEETDESFKMISDTMEAEAKLREAIDVFCISQDGDSDQAREMADRLFAKVRDTFYAKPETSKGEDVEEAAERYSKQFVVEAQRTAKSDFLWGAQWQRQQSDKRIKELEEALTAMLNRFENTEKGIIKADYVKEQARKTLSKNNNNQK